MSKKGNAARFKWYFKFPKDISSAFLCYLVNKQNKLNLLVTLIFLATTHLYITEFNHYINARIPSQVNSCEESYTYMLEKKWLKSNLCNSPFSFMQLTKRFITLFHKWTPDLYNTKIFNYRHLKMNISAIQVQFYTSNGRFMNSCLRWTFTQTRKWMLSKTSSKIKHSFIH